MLPGLGFGQQLVKVNYTDGNGEVQKGSFEVAYSAVIDGDILPLPGGESPVQFTGKGSEFIEVRFSNLNWETSGFSSNIVIEPGDIGVSNRDILKVKVKKIVLKPDNTTPKSTQFTPLSSGSTSVLISYRVVEKGATADVHNSFKRSVSINVGETAPPPPKPDPVVASNNNSQNTSQQESQQQTTANAEESQTDSENEEDTFWEKQVGTHSNNIEYYQQYLQKYPNGKYKEIAESIIVTLEQEKKDAEAEALRIAEEKRKTNPPTTSSSSSSSSNKNSEEELYDRIVNEGRIVDCNEYLRTYADGKYTDLVLQILADKSPIKVLSSQRDNFNKNLFLMELKYVKGKLTHEVFPESRQEDVLSTDWNEGTNIFSIEIAPDKQLKIQFRDSRGSGFKSIQQKLDTRFEPLTVQNFVVYHDESNPFTDSLTFNISGGQGPYFAEFIRFTETEPIYKYPIGNQHTATTLVIGDILSNADTSVISTSPGSYFIRFVDQRGAEGESVFRNGDNDIIRIVPPEEPLPWKLIGGIAGALILLIGLRSFLNARKKAKFQKKVEEARRQKEQQGTHSQSGIGIHKVEKTSSTTISSQPRKVDPRPEPIAPNNPVSPQKRKSTFKITKKQPSFEKPIVKRSFSAVGSSDYMKFDLSTQWQNPAVREVYMHLECATDLNQFIYDHNVNEFLEEKNDMIPEIGGFLMGTYELEASSGQHKVSLEKFQPITAEAQDLYKVEFGVTAWAELANIQDMHEDLVTIGWFHTHPGHGLFLSQPDLRIHEGFFKNNYQLAMEIDTKSQDLDVAFFTRDVQGNIYNSRDRISPSWFRWKEFITKEGQRLQ
ncbi:MAG: hypothetical protein AAF587_20395 [Bacteroidota bacterium]